MRSRPRPRLHWLLTSALLATATGCDEQSEAPLAPEPTAALASASAGLVFAQMSGGYDHTCGITAERRAYCWGL